jgi:hypothetical protein
MPSNSNIKPKQSEQPDFTNTSTSSRAIRDLVLAIDTCESLRERPSSERSITEFFLDPFDDFEDAVGTRDWAVSVERMLLAAGLATPAASASFIAIRVLWIPSRVLYAVLIR